MKSIVKFITQLPKDDCEINVLLTFTALGTIFDFAVICKIFGLNIWWGISIGAILSFVVFCLRTQELWQYYLASPIGGPRKSTANPQDHL